MSKFEKTDSLQGLRFNTQAQVDQLHQEQTTFQTEAMQVADAFGRGEYDAYGPDMATYMQAVDQYRQEIFSEDLYQNPSRFQELQNAIMEKIHNNDALNDAQKTGLEIAVGLMRSAYLTETTVKLAQYIQDQEGIEVFQDFDAQGHLNNIHETTGFTARLDASHAAWQDAMSRLVPTYKDDIEGCWKAHNAYFESDPKGKAMAQILVSMHYIPEDPNFLSYAQNNHWNTFGGDGNLLKGTVFEKYSDQKLSYHGDENAKTAHFGPKMVLFGGVLGQTTAQGEAALKKYFQDTAPEKKNLKIADFGSGPEGKAVVNIVTTWREQGKTVHLRVSDIGNLKAIFDAKADQKNVHHALFKEAIIHFEDLNLSLEHLQKEAGQYDVVSARLAIHQTDPARQKEVLKNLNVLLKPGGVLYVPDVNEKAYFQGAIIPFNNVDREGYLADEVFDDLTAFFEETADADKVNMLYKLPADVHKRGQEKTHLYSNTMLVKATVYKDQAEQIAQAWADKDYEEADRLFEHATQVRPSNYTYEAIQLAA